MTCCLPCHRFFKNKCKCYKNFGERLENFNPNTNEKDRILNEALYLCWGITILYVLLVGIISIIFTSKYMNVVNMYDDILDSS